MRWNTAPHLIAIVFLLGAATAKGEVAPQWIWHDEGNPTAEAPSGERFFRKVVRFDRVRVVKIDVACDNEFSLYLNGQEVGRGDDWQRVYSFDLTDQVRLGENVLAVHARNRGGPAGLLVRGYAGWANGTQWTFDADASWRTCRDEQPGWAAAGFDDSDWKPARVLGPHGEVGPWIGLVWDSGYNGRFRVPEGFRAETVAPAKLTGSLCAMTFDARGRPTISREQRSVAILHDTDNDGLWDQATDFASQITDSQGLCWIGQQLYVSGRGPSGDGLYRVTDTDGDDRADRVELLTKYRSGIGGHGPHAVTLGPDGMLYHVVGNHAWIVEPEGPASPVRQRLLYEGNLLPRYEDPRGHAAGMRVPAGTIWRCDRNGKNWELVACGMRNPYDLAFNSAGDLFTFDADMEWDVGLPWYRPTRVLHCTAGAEFGWRSGSAKWPECFADSLPALINTGRGSPTGVAVYQHHRYPEKYRDSLWLADWTNGRILVAHLAPKGASYSATVETFAAGEPMNVTDLEVGPDGSVYFCTGGWGTAGGVYRIASDRAATPAEKTSDDPVEQVLRQPQPLASWALARVEQIRSELGDDWQPALEKIMADPQRPAVVRCRALDALQIHASPPDEELALLLARDEHPLLRSRAAALLGQICSAEAGAMLTSLLSDPDATVRRCAAEGLARRELPVELSAVLPLLAEEDRFVRYAARLLLERIDPAVWQETVLASENASTVIEGLIALHRRDPQAELAGRAGRVVQVLEELRPGSGEFCRALRAAELLVLAADGREPGAFEPLGSLLLSRFPTGAAETNREIARLLARLQVAEATEELVEALTDPASDRPTQIHYALCLRHASSGWTPQLRHEYLQWFEGKQRWEGGYSFAIYLRNILRDAVATVPADERKPLIGRLADAAPAVAAEVVRSLAADELSDVTIDLIQLHKRLCPNPEAGSASNGSAGQQADQAALAREILLALGRSENRRGRVYLRGLLEHASESWRDTIIVSLSTDADETDWPFLLQGLESTDAQTLRACIEALAELDRRPESAAPYRQLIEACQRLGEQGASLAVALHNHWAGLSLPSGRDDWSRGLAAQKKWFARTFPDVPLETPQAAAAAPQRQRTYEEILAFITREPGGRSGDVQRGSHVFQQSDCIKCHRFEGRGNGIGPDLTTLAKRFDRADILQAIYFPSREINDQYQSVVVETERGLLLTGTAAPAEPGSLALLQADGSLLTLNEREVIDVSPSKVSIMPEGGLDVFSLQDIADLIAYLESGRESEPTGGE